MSVRVCLFYPVSKPLLTVCVCTVCWCSVRRVSTAASRVSPVVKSLPLSLAAYTHTLTGEVQQWLEEGKIQQHFLIYGL